ncbi:MAG TPA: ABC-type transport auxiliary lipoprotein family protein [Gemmatimonadales bacterium]|nr:ABC-type transport auxiliary lipoprotein family protein [Gemmatimonadales bacterium]
MTRHLHSVFCLAYAASLAACAGTPATVERYRLAPVSTRDSGTLSAPPDADAAVIAVEPYATMGIYADPQIVYRLEETTYGAYPNREWAIPLGTMLADATVETMRAIPNLGVRVTDGRTAGSHQLVWRGVVQQFEEVNRGKKVAAAIRLDAALVRTPGDSVVWQGSAASERPVADPTMTAIVRTLSELTSTAIRQLVMQARTAVQAERMASVK